MPETEEVTYTIKNVSKTSHLIGIPNCSFKETTEQVIWCINNAHTARLDNEVLYLSYYCADDDGTLVIEDYTIECNEGRIPDIVQHNRRLSGSTSDKSHLILNNNRMVYPSMTIGS